MIKPDSCNGCPIASFSDGFILSEGEGTSGVAILGEAGGYNEFIDELPFRPHAQAGSKLEEVFRLVGKSLSRPVSRNQFLLYNVVNCHPKGDKLSGTSYEQGAIAHCSPNVDRVLGGFQTNKVKTVFALGNIPVKALLGFSGVAKEKQSITHLRGYVYESKYGYVVPSVHPSYVRRGNNHLTPLLEEDLKKALAVAEGKFTAFPSHPTFKLPTYDISPGLDLANSFTNRVLDNERLVLSYDIETDESALADEDERDELTNSEIIQIQFSTKRGEGIAFPWNTDYMPFIQRLLGSRNVKANHNTWNFDNPILRAKGIKFGGVVHDTMWMFKHWHSRLPRGLQSVVSLFNFPFPWKHMYGSNLPWYGCADVDAVQWIITALPKLMKERGVWEGYLDHVFRIHPILDRASVVGIPVSEEKWVEVGESFKSKREEINQELQVVIPDEVKNIKPRRKDKETGEIDYGYIREPKTIGNASEDYKRLSEKLLANGKRVVSFETYLRRKYNLCYAEFENVANGVRETIYRWCVIEPFKASKDQLVRYLRYKQEELITKANLLKEERQNKYGGRNPKLSAEIEELLDLADDYEVPLDLKTKNETTNKKELEEMFIKTGDPVLEKVVQIRSLDTNITNYLPNWKPKSDGRVHTQWGFTAPTGQKDSRSPNILNLSKHTEYGNEFRSMVEAPPGRVFVEFDKKSFHVATLGYCANDKDYIRFSQIDPHSILGSYIDPSVIGGSISLKWSDEDIKKAAKEFKKRCKENKAKDTQHNIDVRQELAKPTVLGNQLEVGPKKLQRQNRRFIHHVWRSQRIAQGDNGLSAEELQSILANLFQKPVLYKMQLKDKAFLERFLINEFGFIQYFYDVYAFAFNKKSRKWDKREGEGAREPIAFRVQGCAFGMMDVELLEMEHRELCEEHQFVNTIHDSYIFLPEVGKLDRCIEEVQKITNSPCKYLVNAATGPEGLLVKTDVAVGKNWKGYDKDSNPEGMREI
jgi:uracil-DNA glycosylase family 4